MYQMESRVNACRLFLPQLVGLLLNRRVISNIPQVLDVRLNPGKPLALLHGKL